MSCRRPFPAPYPYLELERHAKHISYSSQIERMKEVATIHLKMGSEIPPQSPQNYSHQFTQGAVHNVRHARWGRGKRRCDSLCPRSCDGTLFKFFKRMIGLSTIESYA